MSTVVATPDDRKMAIEVENLNKVYREGWFGRRGITALSEVTFNVARGQIFGLLGPNGAGKTTFIKVLLGIIRKSGGQARMLGYPAGSREGRSRTGYLPEQLRVPSHLTGWTALEHYGNLSNVPTSLVKQKREELLRLVGLSARAKDRVSKYSKGMQQRLGLAQAMLHDPELLVLDEPTDGLDARARAEVRSIIPNLRDQGATIFLNSHLLQEVELVCDHVAILDRGHLRYCGPVNDIGDFVASLQEQHSTQIDVLFDLAGEQAALEEVFTGEYQADVEVFGATQFRVRLQVAGQDNIDQLVDQLRARDVSLVSLARKRLTLEDAFLQIVESNQTI